MSITNIRGARITSTAKVDQILGVYTGSLSVPNTGGQFNIQRVDIASHSLGEPCFVIGIISFDGGTTWQDASMIGQQQVSPFALTIIIPSVYADTVSLRIGSDHVYTLQYKLVLLAKPGQSPQNAPSGVGDMIFSSLFNYQKIAFDENVTTGSLVHNLGYVPKVSAWVDLNDGTHDYIALYTSSNPPLVDETGVYEQDAASSVWFRVYYDD
jgi:hypothetical protein